VVHVHFHSRLLDEQELRDFAVGQTLDDEFVHLAFARGERTPQIVVRDREWVSRERSNIDVAHLSEKPAEPSAIAGGSRKHAEGFWRATVGSHKHVERATTEDDLLEFEQTFDKAVLVFLHRAHSVCGCD